MCLSSGPKGATQTPQSRSIDQSLREEAEKKQVKLLLLGTGDAGKSTFAKQMSVIHTKGGLSPQYMDTFIPVLRDNCLQGMKVLLNFLEETGEVLPGAVTDYVRKINFAPDLTAEVATLISTIWKNKEFQEIAQRADDAQLQGGVAGVTYYFENAERFAESSYRPTQMDIMKARRKTTGIVETSFVIGSNFFTMVDVGGQRSERKKWLHCFGSVSCVIFLTAINEYDMVLEEDGKTNRLVESLKLWKALTISQFFKQTPFVLFLNKSDLFRDKLKRSPLGEIFSDYNTFANDASNANFDAYDKGWKYISKQYKIHFSGSVFYPHLTCALDTENCRKVFAAIQDTLFKQGADQFH